MARTSMRHSNGRHSNGNHKSRNSHKPATSSISPMWLKDFLSEMLAVEKGGVKLYDKALSDLEHSEHEAKLNEFLRQTRRHVELCTEMLEAAGGDSNYQSPGAMAAEHKAECLISTKVPPEMMDLNNIENLVLAETKDHWNWEMLASVAARIEDPELKRMARKAISEVRKQEKMHLDWNEQTLSKLAMESAMHPQAMKMNDNEKDAQDSEKELVLRT